MFQSAKWIWYQNENTPDDYAEFCDRFDYNGGGAKILLSADSDYTLWVNGRYAASNQYGDFEHYKIYDTVDLTEYLQQGQANELLILVHYCGVATSRYRPFAAGLLYEVHSCGAVLAYSRESVLSRRCPAYLCGQQRFVSGQLGFTFSYDATRDGTDGFSPSVCVDKACNLFPRPISKSAVGEPCSYTLLSGNTASDTHFLIDLGAETVGFAKLELVSPVAQTVTVAWGEHVSDGGVRKTVGGRNFFYEYRSKAGYNCFANYMLRLGCRYLEVFCEAPVELIYCGLLPHVYEVKERSVLIEDERDRQIYGICLRTLRCCMLEHYVDTPWREQALYAFDSRNQMLFGYDAFEDGNAAYARANLLLIGEDRREDGLLSICYPAGSPLAIPSFSLYFVIAVWEYVAHTGDADLADKLWEKLKSVLDVFLGNMRDGLTLRFDRKELWNFYDWSPYLSGTLSRAEEAVPDLVLNCLLILALEAFLSICRATERTYPYAAELLSTLRKAVKSAFLTEDGALTVRRGEAEYTELGHALAILADVVTGVDAEALCERLAAGEWTKASLSMQIWRYDALMRVDAEKYRDLILDEIRKCYGAMLDAGSTTVWETERGESDFHNAGSLCHGWSAVPVYVFHRLGVAAVTDCAEKII